MPVSLTKKRRVTLLSVSPSEETSSPTFPFSVNLILLPRRLRRI